MATPSNTRLTSLDNLRGLIMVLMALDHVSLFVHHQHSAEFWFGPWTKYTSVLAFLTRFVTHLCAPGFFFLMGVGMLLFADSRRDKGWSSKKISLYFLKRGALLILLNVLIENFAWTLGTAFQIHEGARAAGPAGAQTILTVLSGLGMAMIGGALLIHTRSAVGFIAAALLILGTALVPSGAQAERSYTLAVRVLYLPGEKNGIWVLYPLLPWLGICGLGIAFGRFLSKGEKTAQKALRAAPLIGVFLVAAALAIRYAGGFGNLRLPRDGSVIEFLNFIKYPPALTFTLFMLGVNLVLLSLLRGRIAVLNVFGQAPLCFYFTHLFIYAGTGALLFRHPSARATMYVVWLLGLLPLYFICRAFRRFKETKDAESLWRLF